MADPLVLLGGMNCSPALWSRLALRAAITPTLDRPDIESQVAQLLSQLPLRFALAGLSLGGIVAMAVTRTAPERVSRLALLSTNPHPPRLDQREAWALQRRRLAMGESPRRLQQDLLPVLFSTEAASRATTTDLALRMADDTPAHVLDAQLRLQASRVDERPRLSAVSCPTLIVAGREDALCSVPMHQEMNRLVPDSRLEVLDRCGHLSPFEQPARVAELLRTWWCGPGVTS